MQIMLNLKTSTIKEWIKPFVVFCLCLASIFLFPFLIMAGSQLIGHQLFGRVIGNFLFFLPQYAFPYSAMTKGNDDTTFIFSSFVGNIFNFIQWLFVAAIFSWQTKKLKLRYLFPLALAVIICSTIIFSIIEFLLFGFSVALDGP